MKKGLVMEIDRDMEIVNRIEDILKRFYPEKDENIKPDSNLHQDVQFLCVILKSMEVAAETVYSSVDSRLTYSRRTINYIIDMSYKVSSIAREIDIEISRAIQKSMEDIDETIRVDEDGLEVEIQ